MVIGPQEVVRSEFEGGLSGPANPIPRESIDCGCGQMRCPKLARFASRGLFVTLVSTIGIMQAAAQAYLLITSSTIARRFQFNPYVIEWIVCISELTPLLFGLLIAYWGNRVHGAAWTGGLVMIQSICYISLIIPHFASNTKIIEETENVTHMSLYSDDSPDLCSPNLSKLVLKGEGSSHSTLGLIIIVQIFAGIGNIAYYALTLSYIDNNTKKTNVATHIGYILAAKFFGILLGYQLAWICLKIDAENFHLVESYQEQIGAWWLGWPILGLCLIIPGFLLAIFPRRLPSEVVEQAAESILDNMIEVRPISFKSHDMEYGSNEFFSSVLRMFENKLIVFNVVASMLSLTALVNFMYYQNIFLESRYYIPRPTGKYLGFGDPWTSRLIANILDPIVVGLTVIAAGLIIAKFRPKTSYVAGYNVIVLATAATVFLALAFATCEKPDIVGLRRDTLILLKYCNKNCRCSRDADFRPVCDMQSKFTFYSACHAGCTGTEVINGTKYYQNCSCVEDMLGLGNTLAVNGPCRSNSCHIGWIIFQVGTTLIRALFASAGVGNIIIIFRSIFPQDKALSIGFHMTWISLVVYIPGRILYERVVNRACRYWGADEVVCHLYDSNSLGDYLCYLSAAITFLAVIFQGLVWLIGKNLRLYGYFEIESTTNTELMDVRVSLLRTSVRQQPTVVKAAEAPDANPANIDTAATVHSAAPTEQSQPQVTEEAAQESTQLKFGPLGSGNPRSNSRNPAVKELASPDQTVAETEDELDSSSEDEANLRRPKKSSEIAYRPLELDSDVESELNGTGPRTRKNVLSKDFDPVLNNVGVASFPVQNRQRSVSSDEEDDSVNLRERRKSKPSRSMQNVNSLSPVQERIREFESRSDNDDGFSKTDSFEYAPKTSKSLANGPSSNREPYRLTGDFNEVGLPIFELEKEPVSPTSPVIKIQSIQASQGDFIRHMSGQNIEKTSPDKEKIESSVDPLKNEDYKLEDIVAEPEVPPLPTSPPPRSIGSSGFGSLPLSESEDKIDDNPEIYNAMSRSRDNLGEASPATSPSGRKLPTLITDF